MSREEVEKLLGGYATGTLTPGEQQLLFEAALEDQELFDALAREQSLRDLLGDPAARAELLAALGDARATWGQRAAGWMRGRAPALATLACFVMVGGYVAWHMRFRPRPEVAAARQPAPESHVSQPPAASAPPRRAFDVQSVKKPAAALPAPLVLRQSPALAQAPPPAPARPDAAAQPGGATQSNFAVDGIADLDTGGAGNATQHFEPSAAAPAAPAAPAAAPPAPRPLIAGQPQMSAGIGGGRGGGGFGGGRLRPAEQVAATAGATPTQTQSAASAAQSSNSDQVADITLKGRDLSATPPTVPGAYFGNTYLTGGNATGAGALSGTLVDSSGAAVPGAQIEAKNLTTGFVRSTVSGPEGLFVFSGLEPARYSLTAKAAGFKTFESDNLDVAADTALSLGKMPLAPGALTEEIAVTAAATPVQTASSENSRLADSSQVNDLTLKGRDLFGALAVAGPQMAPAGSGGAAAAGAAPVARVAAGKLDPTLVALVRGGARGGPAGAGGRARESRLVSGGEVNVRITLTNASKDSLAQLRKAGFTIIHQARNELTGHVAVEKLEAVAQLAFVVWIAPQ